MAQYGDENDSAMNEKIRRQELDHFFEELDRELKDAIASIGNASAKLSIATIDPDLCGEWVVVVDKETNFAGVLTRDDAAFATYDNNVQLSIQTDIQTISQIAAGQVKPAIAILRRRIRYEGDYKIIRPILGPLKSAAMSTIKNIGPENMGSFFQDIVAKNREANPEWAENLLFIMDKNNPKWVADADASRCKVCLQRFSFTNRRHHCRLCGFVVCGNCSAQRLKNLRVCAVCFQKRLAYDNRNISMMNTMEKEKPELAKSETDSEKKGLKMPYLKIEEHISSLQTQPILAAIRPETESMLMHMSDLITKVRSLQRNLGRGLGIVGIFSDLAISLKTLAEFVIQPTLLIWSWSLLLHKAHEDAIGMNHFFAIVAIVMFAMSLRSQAICALIAFIFSEASLLSVPLILTQLLFRLISESPLLFLTASLLGYASSYFLRVFGRLAWIYTVSGIIIFLYYSLFLICEHVLHLPEAASLRVFARLDRVIAPWACREIIALRSVFVKFGQYLGSRADIVSTEWSVVLEKLQDDMPADTHAHVESTILREFGCPVDELFEEFDFTPMASASVAQVHRGVLRASVCPRHEPHRLNEYVEAGLELAIKIQHENIEPVMLSDMVAFKKIVSFIAYLNSRFEVARGLLAAWEKEMVKELDFTVEAQNLIMVRENMRRAGLISDSDYDYQDKICPGSMVLIPRPIHALVSRRAFCMTFIEGFKLTDSEKLNLYGIDRCALMKRVVQAYSSQLYVDGIFNADPHAGNLLVSVLPNTQEARPVLLDFGMVVTLEKEQRLGYCRLINAICDANVSGVSNTIVEVGYQNSQSKEHPERDLDFFTHLLRDTGSRTSQRKQQIAFMRRKKQQRKADLQVDPNKQGRFFQEFPDSLIFLMRILGLIRGLCATLDTPISYIDIMGNYARLGLIRDNVKNSTGICRKLSPKSSLESRLYEILCKAQNSDVLDILGKNESEGFSMDKFVGAQVSVIRKGKVAVNAYWGVLDQLDQREVSDSTLFPLLDLTRVVPLLLLWQFLDQERGEKLRFKDVRYTDKVSKYWSSFYQKSATIENLLSYSDVFLDCVPPWTPARVFEDYEKINRRFEGDDFKPAQAAINNSNYSIYSQGYAICGLIASLLNIEQSSYGSIQEKFRRSLLDPSNAKDVYISAKCCDQSRLATASNGFAKMVHTMLFGGFQFNNPNPEDSGGDASDETIDSSNTESSGNGDTEKPMQKSFMDGKFSGMSTVPKLAEKTPQKAASDPVLEKPEETPSAFKMLPKGALLDPCSVNYDSARSSFIPSFGGFATAKDFAKIVYHGFFKTLSKQFRTDVQKVRTVESSPLFGKWSWGLGLQVFEIGTVDDKTVKVLVHHAFGGSILMIVPEKEIVVTVLVNCLTLDRTVTKELVSAVFAEYGISEPVDVFGGMF